MPNTPLMEYDDGLNGCRGFTNAILYSVAIAVAIGVILLITKLLTGGTP